MTDKEIEKLILDNPDLTDRELSEMTGIHYEAMRKRREKALLCDRYARRIQAMLRPSYLNHE